MNIHRKIDNLTFSFQKLTNNLRNCKKWEPVIYFFDTTHGYLNINFDISTDNEV